MQCLAEDAQDDGNSSDWFLVQLPTRLPPMQAQNGKDVIDGRNSQSRAAQLHGNESDDDDENSSIKKPVALPNVLDSHFDNVLLHPQLQGGKLGKLMVYQSGKTVLRLQQDDDDHYVDLLVHAGLSGQFAQQAVSIPTDDENQKKMVMLGNVGPSTMVATPNVEATNGGYN